VVVVMIITNNKSHELYILSNIYYSSTFHLSEIHFIVGLESLHSMKCAVLYLHCYYDKEISVVVAGVFSADSHPLSQSKQSAHSGTYGGTYQQGRHAQAPKEHHGTFLTWDGQDQQNFLLLLLDHRKETLV